MNHRSATVNSKRHSNYRQWLVTVKSGMTINVFDDIWKLRAHARRGHQINVGWIRKSTMSEQDRALILDVLIHYAKTKTGASARTINMHTERHMGDGIPALPQLRALWSGITSCEKKSVSQFFGTLSKLGHEKYDNHHSFTSTHLNKSIARPLDPHIGALSDVEFSSLAVNVNAKLASIDWESPKNLEFYQSKQRFGQLRNQVSNKLILVTVRRPVQISHAKWSDLIPSGLSFQDENIKSSHEIGSLGAESLQMRTFVAKWKGASSPRAYPEHYPIHLSESFSKVIVNYKNLYLNGLILMMKSLDLEIPLDQTLELMNNMPVFPETRFFSAHIGSVEEMRSMFTSDSDVYHVPEPSVSMAMRVPVISDRTNDCLATSNRIRHTVLTRGARNGLKADQLARITGVTEEASRHYVDLDYQSRRLIDSRYIGNDFLKKAFTGSIAPMEKADSPILDYDFDPIGGAISEKYCRTCLTKMGKPLGCYGCPNFRPILEADHHAVLETAEKKIAINKSSLISSSYSLSIEKLEKQIEWIKITIIACEEKLAVNQRPHA